MRQAQNHIRKYIFIEIKERNIISTRPGKEYAVKGVECLDKKCGERNMVPNSLALKKISLIQTKNAQNTCGH